ncbi:MAG: metallophosphoesterase [Firmicutes bacterium]|nr:metallophosphoesterase [Bacillota bacterium]
MIFVTGDVHREADIHTINPDEFIQGRTLTKEDYVIICGDFGCIWYGDKTDDFWLKWLDSLPWTTLFIDGNHENFDLLYQFPVKEWHGGKVHEIRPSVLHLMRGQVFELDSKKIFTFGGAYSLDVEYREMGKNWWREELPTISEINEARKNLKENNYEVDYIITHDIYLSHPLSKRLPKGMCLYNENQYDLQLFLEELKNEVHYDAWFHGHYHRDEKADDRCYTLFNRIINVDELEQF